MIRNFDGICKLIFLKMEEYTEKYGHYENWGEHIPDDKQLKFIRKLDRVYNNANDNAAKYGYVGVGAITYAEHRLVAYQMRLANKIS